MALLWISLDESGRADARRCSPTRDRLGYRGAVLAAMGGGHLPERAAETADSLPRRCRRSSRRAPAAARCCGTPTAVPSSEIALAQAGLIWGGRLHPLKARVLLETCLRAGLGRDTIAEVFDAFG